MKYKHKFSALIIGVMVLLSACQTPSKHEELTGDETKPKIINIINFIRLIEPRDERITETVLFETTAKQVEIMKQYQLGGTFLLQYDALLDSRYQELLKSLPADSFEIGAWWEIPQPLVENAGMKWRGRYPWDWHADVGFSTGYTPEERERLVDVYMEDFKKNYGYYPKSVGSWFIDAHTLNYMYQKYGIVASCNCKDQIGTDGYNLWGGYWNQAYYPSQKNAYMPAQNEENQIPVPIFRMLGSDPVRQYDNGIGNRHQGVVTLEPVYPEAGGDSAWVNWYLKEFVDGECMEFAYTQAGQENSFIWPSVEKGFQIQMPLIAKLRDQKKVQVETLAESGKWFKANYKTTPATSVTVNNDLDNKDVQTVWFNSRFYRANLLWENGTLRFRDIHLFDENMPSKYLTERVNSNECFFNTLPFVDGHVWSSSEEMSGLNLKAVIDGTELAVKGGKPEIKSSEKGLLQVVWPLSTIEGNFVVKFTEQQISMKLESKETIDWFWELDVKSGAELPFVNVTSSGVNCEFDGVSYSVNADEGIFAKSSSGAVIELSPVNNTIILSLYNQSVNN
ncbi:hypothetical protein [uncultured Draconibacterium sp.]|uniref:hypothetical protein n=1 Tax=uncultured Draconibacterium sp. TaxID=1573823 RepID=UPI0029C710DC|nr:hypothetical protein [uncultured Draconibacterium sp.]